VHRFKSSFKIQICLGSVESLVVVMISLRMCIKEILCRYAFSRNPERSRDKNKWLWTCLHVYIAPGPLKGLQRSSIMLATPHTHTRTHRWLCSCLWAGSEPPFPSATTAPAQHFSVAAVRSSVPSAKWGAALRGLNKCALKPMLH